MELPKEFKGEGIFVNARCGIYAIVNPLGEIYIGQSEDIEGRIRGYKKGFGTQSKLKSSMFFHGRKNHKYYLVEEIKIEGGQQVRWDREKYWIAKFKSEGFIMLNSNAGGGGSADNLRKANAAQSINRMLFYKKTEF